MYCTPKAPPLIHQPPRGTKSEGEEAAQDINVRKPNLAKGSGRDKGSKCPLCASLEMLTLPLSDGRRDSRSDDQFAAFIAKMPWDERFLSEISIPQLSGTHELHPGEMHCEIGI